jgi:hypothetical protein
MEIKADNKTGKVDDGRTGDIPGGAELEKSKSHIIVEIIEYMANSVVIKTIIKNRQGI